MINFFIQLGALCIIFFLWGLFFLQVSRWEKIDINSLKLLFPHCLVKKGFFMVVFIIIVPTKMNFKVKTWNIHIVT